MAKIEVKAKPDDPNQKKHQAKKKLRTLKKQIGNGNLGNQQIKDILLAVIEVLDDEPDLG